MSGALGQLPVLGVGASLSLSARPDPLSLVKARGGPSFVEYAGRVDFSEVRADIESLRAAGARVLFHPSYINFCGSYANSARWLRETAHHVAAAESPWFAQDCAYCFWSEGHGYSSQLGYFLPPILNEASLAYALERVREVQRVVPAPIAVEPPPMAFVVGSMPLLTFFGRLAEAADCAILLDVGHLISYEMASGKRVRDAFADVNCERVIEVHIAGGRLERTADGPIYIDAHERDILPEAWVMLAELLPELPALRAVCFECEGANEARVLGTLERLRRVVIETSCHRALVATVKASS